MKFRRYWLVLCVVLAGGCAKDGERAGERPDMQRGMQVYRVYCQECHDTGKGGAPELEDVEEWDDRAFIWKEVQRDHAAKGFLGMPAKGAHPQLSQRDLQDALYYMNIKIRSEEE